MSYCVSVDNGRSYCLYSYEWTFKTYKVITDNHTMAWYCNYNNESKYKERFPF